jgi:hypothetical protein
MKYHLYFFIIASGLGMGFSSYSMENSKTYTPIIKEITCIQHPHQNIYLSDNTSLVLHEGSKDSEGGCSIINVMENKEIKKICPHPNIGFASGIALHPNRTKMAFFYHTQDSEYPKIAIYNLETGKREWSKKYNLGTIVEATFSHLDDLIALSGGGSTKIHIYNYKTLNEPTIFDIKNRYEETGTDTYLAFHPTNRQELYVGRKNLYQINFTTNQCKEISRACGLKYAFNSENQLVAKYNDKSIYIFNPAKEFNKIKINFLMNSPNNYIKEIAFHPNNAVLAISDSHNCISFWDIATKEIICQTSPLDKRQYLNSSYLSFSLNGKNLLWTDYNASYGKCITIPVPFEVIYKDITKEQGIFLYFFLKNYIHKREPLPKDILYLIMHLYKR